MFFIDFNNLITLFPKIFLTTEIVIYFIREGRKREQIKEIEGKLTILEQKYPECANAPSNGDSVPADSNGVISNGGGATSFPSFDGKDLDGNDIKSSDFFKSNNVTVVNYWFSTCKPCVGELPELEALNKKLAEKGGQVVGINTFTIDGDKTAISEAKDILSKKGVTYKNIWFDSNSDAGKFTSGIFSYPTTYVVDKNGNLCPDATHKVKFNVRGAGTYRAAANGDAASLESFQAPQMSLFKGQLTAIVQTEEQPGVIMFEASAPGVKSAKIELISE